jgi:hypothetical protein
MSQIIKIKSGTSGQPSSLARGELAINVSNGAFYFGDAQSATTANWFFSATSANTVSATTITAAGDLTVDGSIKLGVTKQLQNASQITTNIQVNTGQWIHRTTNVEQMRVTLNQGTWFNATNNSSNDFRVDGNADYLIFADGGNNRVGIKTSTPNEELTVVGSISASTSMLSPIISGVTLSASTNIDTPTVSATTITAAGDYLSGTTNLLDIFASSAITNQDVYWSANTNGSISNSGLTNINVGIGKIPATWQLDIDSSTAYITAFDGTNNTGIVINSNNTTSSQIIGYSNSSGAYNDIEIRANNSAGSGVYLDGSTSRVGVGTITPNEELTVTGSISASTSILSPIISGVTLSASTNIDTPTVSSTTVSAETLYTTDIKTFNGSYLRVAHGLSDSFTNTILFQESQTYFQEDIKMADNKPIRFGVGSDMQIYHDGSDNHITAAQTLNVCTTNTGVAINLGATTSEVTAKDNFNVSGSSSVYSDFTVDNDGSQTLHAKSSTNRVGVGTRAATHQLTVSGDSQGTGSTWTNTGNIWTTLTFVNGSPFVSYTPSDLTIPSDMNIVGQTIRVKVGSTYYYGNTTATGFASGRGYFGLTWDSANITFCEEEEDCDGLISYGGPGDPSLNPNHSFAVYDGTNMAMQVTGTSIMSGSTDLLDIFASSAITNQVYWSANTNNNISTSGNSNIQLSDNTRLKFGAGDDLQIYSDSTNGRIAAGSGVLQIEADTLDFTDGNATEYYIRCVANGAVSLYHDANLRITTTPTGSDVNGSMSASTSILSPIISGVTLSASTNVDAPIVSATTITGTTSVSLPDNGKLKLGNAGDLEIYHNGSNSIIEDTGTGTIFYRSGTQTFQNAAASKTMATFNAANSVDLNYNNNTKFKTTNTGIDVTGEVKGDSLDIDGNSQLDGTITVGVDDTGYDVKFYGDTASAYMLWDTSDDDLVLGGAATLKGSRRFEKSTATDENVGQGDIIYYGAGSTTAGDIVYMKTDGEWGSAQADATGTSTSMLGIALGTDPDVNGVLVRGTYTLDHDVGNDQGVPLYLSDGTAGQATATIPDSSGDVVRIIGYNLGDDDEIFFDPDKTWVQLT